jgi:hypothetical protein
MPYPRRHDNLEEILEDGERLRVPMTMADSANARVLADRFRGTSLRWADGSPGVVGHRPGFVTAGDSERIRHAAWLESRQALCDAWRTPARDAAAGSYPLSAGEGSACTINGAPGTLVREGDVLVCRPHATDAARRPTSMADAQRIRDEAWRQSVTELENAWRGGRPA